MDDTTLTIFLVLVFATIFLLSQVILVPTFGTGSIEARKFRDRLKQITEDGTIRTASLVRQKYLKSLSPLELRMELAAGSLFSLNELIEQCGKSYAAYRVVSVMLALGIVAGVITWLFTHNLAASAIITIIGFYLPLIKLKRERNKRLEKFEEQLPDALDMMVRALRAGYPFIDAMAYISKEMQDPIAVEFGMVFDEINYGRDMKTAFNYLLMRVPSMSLLSVTTAILIQHETGGNLAELIQKTSLLLRKRFKFRRHVKSISAEGRMSAWVLALTPFVAFFVMYMMDPKYFNLLLTTETGHNMIITGLVLIVIGSFWVNKLVRINI